MELIKGESLKFSSNRRINKTFISHWSGLKRECTTRLWLNVVPWMCTCEWVYATFCLLFFFSNSNQFQRFYYSIRYRINLDGLEICKTLRIIWASYVNSLHSIEMFKSRNNRHFDMNISLWWCDYYSLYFAAEWRVWGFVGQHQLSITYKCINLKEHYQVQ